MVFATSTDLKGQFTQKDFHQLTEIAEKLAKVASLLPTQEQKVGNLISKYFQGNGESFYRVAHEAFEDWNYHTFNEKFAELWRNEQARFVNEDLPNFDKIAVFAVLDKIQSGLALTDEEGKLAKVLENEKIREEELVDVDRVKIAIFAVSGKIKNHLELTDEEEKLKNLLKDNERKELEKA